MEARVLTDGRGLDDLAPEWDALAARCAASPFATAGWLVPWWRHLGHGTLHLVEVRDGDRLVAVGPFFVDDARGEPVLRLLGAGISDQPDVVVAPEAPHAADAIWHELARARAWRRCELHDVSPGSTLLARLPSSGLTVGQARGTTCPVLSLPATRSEFVEALPRNLARALTTTFSRLEGEGPVSVERATPDTLREFVEALISLHEQRWTRRASHGMLSVPAVRAFHRAAAPRLMDGGWLGVWGLRLGGRLVAVLYALRARQRLMG